MNGNRIDWTKKGLGWIPDLPAISETSKTEKMREPGNLRSDDATDAIQLTTQLTNLIDYLLLSTDGQEKTDQQKKYDEIRQNLSSLKKKFVEDISFREVQFYKVLSEDQPIQSKEEVICLRQALLKFYLKIKMNEESKNKFKKFIEKIESLIEIEPNIFKFIVKHDESEWLRKGEFDDKLKEIVISLQEDIKLVDDNFVVDGIVGLKTATKIERELQSNSDESSIIFLPIPPIITDDILEIGFDYLRLAWLKGKLRKKTKDEQAQKVLDDYFLSNASKILDCLKQENKQHKQELLREELHNIGAYLQNFSKHSTILANQLKDSSLNLNTILGVSQDIEQLFALDDHEDFIKFFRRQFDVIEPLVAAVYLVASPFSGYANPRQAIASNFKKLESYLNPSFVEKSAIYESFAAIFQAYSGQGILSDYEDSKREQFWIKKLVNGALTKVQRIRRNETTPPDHLRFFDFIEEILSDFDFITSNFINGKIETSDFYSMLYNKHELFAIREPALGSDSDAANNTKETSEVFPPTPLKIPITIELIKVCSGPPGNTKNYYFFLPNVVDLSLWCSPVKDQGSLNTCTVFSGIALVEYWFQKRFDKREDLSALFVYKTARDLMQRYGDMGVSVQATLQAMALFGIPPEDCWPYQEERFDDVPPPFCYSYAQNYQTLKYFRLDSADLSSDPQLLLFKIRATLAAGIPCMFGLTLYNSVYHELNIKRGHIPYPSDRDTMVGGHNLVAVGYNDYKVVDQASGIPSSQGALLVRNSWGPDWGKEGYGWLPYDYVLKGLTADWWSVIKAEWFDSRTLGSGVRRPGGDPVKSSSFPPRG